MELSHTSIALRNRKLLRETNDHVLKSLNQQLLDFFGGFRGLINLALKYDTNITHSKHLQLFKILHTADTKYKKEESNDDENKDFDQDIDMSDNDNNDNDNNDDDDNELSVCSLSDICLSTIFTYLNYKSHSRLQRSCILFYIVGSTRASFLSHYDMLKFRKFPKFAHHVAVLENYNKLSIKDMNDEQESRVAIGSLSAISSVIPDGEYFSELIANSGYISTMIQIGNKTMNKHVLRFIVYILHDIGLQDSNLWILYKNGIFNLIKRIIINSDIAGKKTLKPSINILLDFIACDSIYRSHAIECGILNDILNDIDKWTSKSLISDAYRLIFVLIPKNNDYYDDKTVLKNKNILDKMLKIIIFQFKKYVCWIYENKFDKSSDAYYMAMQFTSIFRYIHENYYNIDFNKLDLMESIIKYVNTICLKDFNYTDDYKKSILDLIRCNWHFIDTFHDEISIMIERNGTISKDILMIAVGSNQKLKDINKKDWFQHSLPMMIYEPISAIAIFPIIDSDRIIYDDKILTAIECANNNEILQFMNNKQCIDRLCKLYRKQLKLPLDSSEFGGPYGNRYVFELSRIGKLISLFSKMIESGIQIQNQRYYIKYDEKVLSQCIEICKNEIMIFWNNISIIQYLRYQYEWEPNYYYGAQQIIIHILNDSLVVGQKIYKNFICENSWIITDKVYRMLPEEQFFKFLYNLSKDCGKDLREKLINLDIMTHLQSILSDNKESGPSVNRDEIIDCMELFGYYFQHSSVIKSNCVKQLLLSNMKTFGYDFLIKKQVEHLIAKYF